MAERRTAARRDDGFTLIELLITLAISGIITGVIATAVYVSFSNNSATLQRFNGANDSLTLTNVFSSDVSSTPPGGREVGPMASECSSVDPVGSFNVLRLTWSEQAAGVTTYYRTNYRLVNDSSGAGTLVRISCTSTSGPHGGYGAGASRLVGSSLTTIPASWTAGQVPAVLSYSSLDADDLTLTLTVNTKPNPTTVIAAAQRTNPGVTLPPPPNASTTASIRTLTTPTESTFSAAGVTLHFSTVVLNSGTTTLSSVGIADGVADAGSVSCPTSFLVSGGSTTCTFTHISTLSDIDAGGVTSTTTASGVAPGGTSVTDASTAVSVAAVAQPALTATKVANPTTCTVSPCYKLAGDVITYTVTATNGGNNSLQLTTPWVSDSKSDGSVTCPTTTIAPLASATCTYQHTVVSTDLGVGKVVASAATVTASSQLGVPITGTTGSVSVPFQATPALSATKSSTSSTFVTVGQVLPYTIVVTNTGNVSLSAISVTDAKADPVAGITCSPTTIAPSATSTCTAQHTVNAADMTAGSVVNQATAFATPASGGGQISTLTNTVTIPFSNAAAMQLTKVLTTSPNTFKNIGDVLDYTLTVKNTGGQPLMGIVVSDPNDSDGLITCAATTLVSLATTTCAARHVVVAGDLGNPIINTATATANSGVVTATSNTVTANFVPAPNLQATMSAAPSPFTTAFATLTYTIVIHNTGNVPLTFVGITARTLAASTAPSCGASTLAVGASTTCTSTYATTVADSGSSVTNAVTGSGTFNGTTYTATSGSVAVSSAVPCFVQSIAANPSSVARNGGNGNNSQNLSHDVDVTVTTGGINCAGLRIRYFPGNPASVTDVMSHPSSSTWTYTIQSNGNSASSWTSTGPKPVDVLPSSGSAAIGTASPFTVSL